MKFLLLFLAITTAGCISVDINGPFDIGTTGNMELTLHDTVYQCNAMKLDLPEFHSLSFIYLIANIAVPNESSSFSLQSEYDLPDTLYNTEAAISSLSIRLHNKTYNVNDTIGAGNMLIERMVIDALRAEISGHAINHADHADTLFFTGTLDLEKK